MDGRAKGGRDDAESSLRMSALNNPTQANAGLEWGTRSFVFAGMCGTLLKTLRDPEIQRKKTRTLRAG
jgi:hypothetical protein